MKFIVFYIIKDIFIFIFNFLSLFKLIDFYIIKRTFKMSILLNLVQFSFKKHLLLEWEK